MYDADEADEAVYEAGEAPLVDMDDVETEDFMDDVETEDYNEYDTDSDYPEYPRVGGESIWDMEYNSDDDEDILLYLEARDARDAE
jgi:hypothetical protein